MNTSRLGNGLKDDPFGPYTEDIAPPCLVEITVPSQWRVRVVEGAEFNVRLLAIEAESDDDGDSDNVSPNQPRGSSG
jgi:hypothetical protein